MVWVHRYQNDGHFGICGPKPFENGPFDNRKCLDHESGIQMQTVTYSLQMTLLCGSPIKRCTQWSEKTLAKAFDLRLNCGDRAYKYLLEQGYPLPSIKTMQRHIRNVEIKLQHPDATFITQDESDGEGVEIQHEEQMQHHEEHHMIPVQHAYLQQYGNQHTIVKVGND